MKESVSLSRMQDDIGRFMFRELPTMALAVVAAGAVVGQVRTALAFAGGLFLFGEAVSLPMLLWVRRKIREGQS